MARVEHLSFDNWRMSAIENNSREINGHVVTFAVPKQLARYDMVQRIMREGQKLFKTQDIMSLFDDSELLALVNDLCELAQNTDDLFDEDITAQVAVAATAAEICLEGFIDAERLMLADVREPAVRKQFKKKDTSELDALGPHVKRYWFFWRPVLADACSYEAMFVEERFSFHDIHRLHEMLDVRAYTEALAYDVPA